jgi:hypothetical protein
MKVYRFNDLAASWWAELRTDGMQESITEKVLAIKSQVSGSELNPTDLEAAIVATGLPTLLGTEVSEVALKALAIAQNLTMVKYYEDVAGSTKYTALALQTTPTFNPAAGAVPFGQVITISSANADNIYYTQDNTLPSDQSIDQAVTACTITAEGTVKAIAYDATKYKSLIAEAVYTQAVAAAPTNVVLAVGSATPVGGVVNVAIPAAGATDNTGKVTGWVTGTANKIKITVTDAANTASTLTINGAAYVSAADYAITAVGTLTVVLTTTRANYKTQVRTFTIDVTA